MISITCNRIAFLAVFAMAALTFDAQAGAAKKETQAELEAREAAEEDAAEAKLDPEKVKHLFDGRFVLNQTEDAKEPNAIVGTFISKNGSYLIKVESAAVREELKQYHNKEVSVVGKVRNQGKYLIVNSIVHGGAAPVFVRRKGGI